MIVYITKDDQKGTVSSQDSWFGSFQKPLLVGFRLEKIHQANHGDTTSNSEISEPNKH